MNFVNKLLTIMLTAFLGIFSLLFVLLPDRDFSEMENRMLQKKPPCTWNSLFSGRFSLAAEKYLADQFAYRDAWVGIKSTAELALQKKDNNGVYFGQESCLLEKPERLNEALLAENIAAVNQFAAKLPGQVYFLLAPSAIQIMGDKLPPFAELDRGQDPFARARAQFSPDIRLIDPSLALATHRHEYIYYKTDHHWTSLGAFYAYREAGPVLGFDPWAFDDFSVEQVSDNFYGTLQAKSGRRFIPPDAIQLFKPKRGLAYQVEYVNENKKSNSLYVREHLLRKDQYAVFLDGNHALLKITTLNHALPGQAALNQAVPDKIVLNKTVTGQTAIAQNVSEKAVPSEPGPLPPILTISSQAASGQTLPNRNVSDKTTSGPTRTEQNGRKLLLIKDSFANSLVPFLANHYAEIHLIDLRYFNLPLQVYIEQQKFNEILFVYNAFSFAGDPAIRKILVEK